MKTYEIKDLLKKELLLVEFPEDTQFDVLVNNPLWKDGIKFLTGTDEKFHFIKGSYTLLGKPDEIKEEDVKDLIEKRNGIGYIFGNTTHGKAIDSFNSALESEIYWVNPLGKTKETNLNDSFFGMQTYFNDEVKFDKAQEKTFDKKRTLIFVKN